MPAASPLDLARSAAIEVMIGGLNVLDSVGRESMVHDGSGRKVAPGIGLVYNLSECDVVIRTQEVRATWLTHFRW